jgi:vacuolar-type H+-ATPase subunit E/Vma4
MEIKLHIKKETESEIQEILQKAEDEAKAIIEEARKRATTIRKEQEQKRIQENLSKERSELSILRISQKAKTSQIKAELLDRTFEEAQKRINQLTRDTGSPTYKELLTKLVVEGVSKMKSSKFVIQSNQATGDLLKKNLKEISKSTSEIKGEEVELRILPNPATPPGVIIQSTDEIEYYNNTLESRLTGARERLRGEIYGLLFKEGK